MSKPKELTLDPELYTPDFNNKHANSSSIMAKARRASDLSLNYKYAFGVDSLFKLNPQLQRFILDQARITIEPEEWNV